LKHTILLVDDHEIVRKGIRGILGSHWEICGEAANGAEAVQKTAELKPDLVVMDLSMPVMNGLEAARQIRALGLSTKIVILSMHDSAEIRTEAKNMGADDCLTKTSSPLQIVACIQALLEGVPS
jgi:DNA-binding NarL/FixJ family response regulator